MNYSLRGIIMRGLKGIDKGDTAALYEHSGSDALMMPEKLLYLKILFSLTCQEQEQKTRF